MQFIDEIEIRVRAGHGGPGSVSFRREKYEPNGGPNGGDGGRGGNLFLRANPNIQTLGKLAGRRLYEAQSGDRGRSQNRSGGGGSDFFVEVPPGTRVEDASGEILGEVIQPEETLLVARGGKGGLGNTHFANSVRQAPTYAQPGEPGEEKKIRLQLRLLADVGLLGLPNSGKSTLLAALSHSNPTIADYPFTTLTPNIGVVENEAGRRLLLADIPGIIKGAHEGTGLGLSFLRHIERVRLIVYVLDMNGRGAKEELEMLQSELSAYSARLRDTPGLVVVNKIDLADYDESFLKEFADSIGKEILPPTPDHIAARPKDESKIDARIVFISALEKRGTAELSRMLFSFFPDRTFAEEMLRTEYEPPSLAENSQERDQ